MKDIITKEEDQRMETLTRLMQINPEVGSLAVVYALTELLAVEVEENLCCVTCQRKAVWWHTQLARLIEEYDEKFPEAEAVDLINSIGARLIQ
jgi:hypothetical protein